MFIKTCQLTDQLRNYLYFFVKYINIYKNKQKNYLFCPKNEHKLVKFKYNFKFHSNIF